MSQSVKNLVWSAARATTVAEFKSHMDEMKKNFPEAFNWLADKPQQQWSRSHFRTLPKCDILLNNLCESFNRFILEARGRPILTLVEMVRCKLMNRFYKKISKVDTFEVTICPRIQKKLDKNKEMANRFWPQPSTRRVFQVKSPGSMYIVDLDERTCSCRKWDLTGIPCPHSISANHYCHHTAEEFVDKCYLVDTQRQIYKEAIKPIMEKANGLRMSSNLFHLRCLQEELVGHLRREERSLMRKRQGLPQEGEWADLVWL